MSTIGNTYLNLADMRRSSNNKDDVAAIINLLAQTNSILDDAIVRPCNSGKVHEHSVLSGLPTNTWGQLYQGIPNSKAKRTQVKDSTGFIEGRSSVDCRMAEVEKNLGAFRLQEAQAHIEGISQEWARALMYESQAANANRITGFAPRFNDLSAETGSQIIDAGGTGSDNTSIWFITWGLDAAFMIHPEQSSAGIQRIDHNKQKVVDGSGDSYFAYEEEYRVHAGLCINDWRKIVRIANIDVSELEAGKVDIYKWMRKALYTLHGARAADIGTGKGGNLNGNFNMGRTAVYCNSSVFEALDAAGTNSGSTDNYVRLSKQEIDGKEVDTYRKFPVRQVDQISNNEARVV